MSTKEIIKQNIENLGLHSYRSIKGKGLEIFDAYSFFDGFFTDSKKEILLKRLKLKNPKQLFIKSCVVDNKYFEFENFKDSQNSFPIEEAIRNNFNGFTEVSIYYIPKKLGYIPVSKYDTTLESQKELIIDLFLLQGLEVYEDVEYDPYNDDGYISFDYHSDEYWNGNYNLLHGNSIAEDIYKCNHVNGRLSSIHWSVVDDYWNFIDQNVDYWKEIDPEETISIYHRKGKDWYVGYSLNEEEVTIAYLEDYKYNNPEEYDEYCTSYLVYTPNQKLLNRFVKMLESDKKELEIKSYIYNELRLPDGYGSSDWSYNDDIFNLKIIDNEFEDRYEAAYTLMDYVDWKNSNNLSEKLLVESAYNKWIADNLSNKKLFGKYKHFMMLEKLAEADGKKIVYSRIGDFTEDENYAIAFKNEEYHFTLGELFNSIPKQFYKNISKKLTKRLLERYEQAILFQKAKYVFVGLQDSYEAGNCKAGTNSWVKRFGIDTSKIGGIRGDEILNLDFNNFTKRAVIQAIKKYKLAY